MTVYDLVVIGGGTAGLVTAAGGAGLGARVALVERERLGGECLWTGCVPSKALLACARAASDARRAARFGVSTGDVSADLLAALRWVREAQRRVEPHDSPERFRGLGVEVVEGEGRFLDARTVAVDGRKLQAKQVVIATGTRAAVPPIPGLDAVPYFTNESIFTLDRRPRALLVLGAGPIGLELAQAFTRLGTPATVVELSPVLLPREDEELAAVLGAALRADGVDVRLGQRVTSVRQEGGDVVLACEGADGASREVRGDALLVATGRRSNVETLALDRAGVATDAGDVVVDERLRTTARGVWAAGDVTGGLRFTHVADYEARLVLRNALFPLAAKRDYSVVPWVTFTDPELAHVGLTEREARARHGGGVGVWRRPFADVDRAIADDETAGMVKLVTDARGRIVGGHIVGHGAGTMIAEVALAMQQRLSVGQLAAAIHAYPTYPEAIRQAAELRLKARFTGVAKRAAGWFARR